MANILILSAGTRNKIVQFFKESLHGQGLVMATDCSELAPAIYDADRHFIVKPMVAEGYLQDILKICADNHVDGVLSLIDPELSLLAAHTQEFQEVGTTVIGSSWELCERSLDKFQMFSWLQEHGYPCAKSYLNLQDFERDRLAGTIDLPVFVKPVRGSASIAIAKVDDEKYLQSLMETDSSLMIQQYLRGQEIGADVYIDLLSGQVVSIFTKKKLKMRAGETDKAVSFKDLRLFDLIQRFVTEAGYRGQIDIDLFDVDGTYYLSEVNPRFGGGYPHAYLCGVNHMDMILRNLAGKTNEPCIGQYDEGVYMMKYVELKTLTK